MTATPKKTGWTAERRQKHAEAIKRWAPWTQSTGPRTASGKARAAQNAYKHGRRARPQRLMNQALAAHSACLRAVDAHRRARKLKAPNELLALLASRVYFYNRIFRMRVHQTLHYERLCKKLAFSPPKRQIVNANDN